MNVRTEVGNGGALYPESVQEDSLSLSLLFFFFTVGGVYHSSANGLAIIDDEAGSLTLPEIYIQEGP